MQLELLNEQGQATAKVEAPESGEFGYTRGAYTMTSTDPKV